jgi:hypothetical protein
MFARTSRRLHTTFRRNFSGGHDEHHSHFTFEPPFEGRQWKPLFWFTLLTPTALGLTAVTKSMMRGGYWFKKN